MKIKLAAVGTVHRHACIVVTGFGEVHAPEKIRWFSPAASRCEAALSPECLPERDGRCECVGDFPKRKFVISDQKRDGEKSADEPTVINAARSQKVECENLDVFLHKKHQDLRTEQPADQCPE